MEIRETLTMSVYMHICPNIQIPKRAWVVYTLGGRDWVHYGVVQAVRSLRKLCQLAYCSRDVKESFKGGNFLQISCDSTHDKGPFHSSNWWQGGVMKSHLTLFSICSPNNLLFFGLYTSWFLIQKLFEFCEIAKIKKAGYLVNLLQL